MARSIAYRGAAPLLAALRPALDGADVAIAAEPAAADAVVTFFTTQRELEDAYFASDGLIATMAPGSLLIDLSPATPAFSRDATAVATVSDLAMVAAPITPRDLAAESPFAPGNLCMFVGGDEAAIEAARFYLDLIHPEPVRCRNAAEAQVARAAVNLQTTALVLSAVEASVLVRRCDIGFGETPLARPMPIDELEASMLAAIGREAFANPFTVEMMMAQLTATLEAADDVDLILPQAEAAQHLLELLAIIGGVDKAPAALALVYGDEEAASRHGLDWSRAESFKADEHDHDLEDADDEGEFPLMMGLDEDEAGLYQDFEGTDPFEYSSN